MYNKTDSFFAKGVAYNAARYAFRGHEMLNLVGEYPEPPYFWHILHADISSGSFDIRNREGEIKTAGSEITWKQADIKPPVFEIVSKWPDIKPLVFEIIRGYGWRFHFFGYSLAYFAACIVSGRTSAVKYFSPSRKSLTAAALPNERVDKAKYTGVSAVPHFPTHQLSFSCRVIGGSFCHRHLLLCPCLIDMAEPLFFCIGKERRQLCFFTEKNTVIP